ncbi:ATP-binding protein [Enterococcus faecium]|uniref:ATP-binding protein n=1 Tax=Enterococcus faecium TaxID=1352 RepID=UPI002091541A|nr:ATP-binding protein [Enterococcus faecium]MCO5433526.1 ATP-binding protein [Enterococcus faecium]MCO5451557.1 ATP-binding protein [Enterococcus faecium]
MTNSKEVNLSIDSRIISHLGEALIDNEKVALLELIKNASDADANICTVKIDTTYQSKYGEGRIVIEDDGTGMNPFIIENGFLRIATTIKQKYQKISPKFNRLAQGNKGIGRLALNQLGEFLSVSTKLDTSLIEDSNMFSNDQLKKIFGYESREKLYQDNNDAYHNFDIDWKRYENSNGSVEDVSLDLYTLNYDRQKSIFNHRKNHGTRIEVLGLKGLSFWRNAKVARELESDVLEFLNPYLDEKANFRVSIDLDGQKFNSNLHDKNYIKKVCDSGYSFKFNYNTSEFSFELFRNPKYIKRIIDKLLIEIEKYDFDLKSIVDYENFYKKYSRTQRSFLINRLETLKKSFPQAKVDEMYVYTDNESVDNIYLPGSFNGEFYAFDLGQGNTPPDVRKVVDSIVGVKLYRNNFRIFPYGDVGNEWLGMSSFNTRNKSVLFKTHTTTGYVDINGEKNLELLEELTNRQGLVLNNYGTNFLTLMREVVYKSAAIEDSKLSDTFSFNRKKAREMKPGEVLKVAGLIFEKRKNYQEEALNVTEKVSSGLIDIKKKTQEPNLLTAEEIEMISSGLEKEVAELKNNLTLIEKEFANKAVQVEDQNKYIEEMYPIIGASIISETLAHEIIRLSNNIKSYTRNIRTSLVKIDNSEVNLNLKLIDSDIKFLARYASLLDVNSYSKRRRFEALYIGKTINEILNNSPLLRFKNKEINYDIIGTDFEATIVKDSFKIVIENLFINSAYWLERNSIEKASVTFRLNEDSRQLLINDNGLGINSELSQRVFEPFVTNKPEGDGRGMGLYIVNNLLYEIGANIELSNIKNEYGNLYQFIITFPEDER